LHQKFLTIGLRSGASGLRPSAFCCVLFPYSSKLETENEHRKMVFFENLSLSEKHLFLKNLSITPLDLQKTTLKKT